MFNIILPIMYNIKNNIILTFSINITDKKYQPYIFKCLKCYISATP